MDKFRYDTLFFSCSIKVNVGWHQMLGIDYQVIYLIKVNVNHKLQMNNCQWCDYFSNTLAE
jgi:hypothetical protein